MSIEELTQIDVTTVSRRPERLSDAAAAVSVITSEELQRSGVTTLAEAMRLGDGVDVARVNPNTWAVTARGFNISTANKLLVLLDGRSVYSPLFSGTFWEEHDTVLADVDRIEIVRGPGGATWGANAVNGVVNIISKSAAATQGTLASISAGTADHAILSGRHGGTAWNGGHYRVYGTFRLRDAGVNVATGSDAGAGFTMGRSGFRVDSDERRPARWLIEGETYRGTIGLANTADDGDLAGGHVLARYARRSSSASEFTAQASYDRTWRRIPRQFEELRDTFHVTAQQTAAFGRHRLIGGGEVRVSHANDRGVAGFVFDPEKRTNELFGVFVQDEISLRANRLSLILGSKFEANDYTGFEVQPTARLRWIRTSRDTVWGGVSRAVRLPTRFDTDLRIVNPITRVVTISGTDDFRAESVVAFEAGYRMLPHPRVAVDVALFTNRYNDLRSIELPDAPGRPLLLRNLQNARVAGLEAASTLQPIEGWRVRVSYAYLHESFSADPSSTDRSGGSVEANDPSHLFTVRSFVDLREDVQLDGIFRAVSSRPFPEVPGYAGLDLRLGWEPRPGWELSFVGQNLLQDEHPELFGVNAPRYAFGRAAYVRSVWSF